MLPMRIQDSLSFEVPGTFENQKEPKVRTLSSGMSPFFSSCFCRRRREVIALARPQATQEEKQRGHQNEQMQFKETRNVNIQTKKSFDHTRSRYKENLEHLSVEQGPLLCSRGPAKLVRDVRVQSQTSCLKESRVLEDFEIIGEVGSKVGYLRVLPASEATAEGEQIRRALPLE